MSNNLSTNQLLRIIEKAKRNKRTWLDLRNNNISKIPPEIASLDHIEAIDLGGNDLSIFPNYLCKMKNLQRLYLANNKINLLPREILQLKLTELDLRGNPISMPPEILEKTREPV